MRRRHQQSRVIAYAIPQDKRQSQTFWAVAAGLLTSIAVYAIAALFNS